MTIAERPNLEERLIQMEDTVVDLLRDLTGEIHGLRQEMHGEFRSLSEEMNGEFQSLRQEMHGRFKGMWKRVKTIQRNPMPISALRTRN